MNKNTVIYFVSLLLYSCSSEERDIYKLDITNHRFNPEVIRVHSNKKIKLIISNNDDTTEEFESDDLKREKIIPPHNKISILVGPLKAGTYEFYGDFHKEMARGKLIVE